MNQETIEIKRTAVALLPTDRAKFKVYAYQTNNNDQSEHIALVLGDVTAAEEPILTRIHSKCLTGDTFGSLRCDCREQLVKALEKIAEKGQGILIYLDQEGRGIGLLNKIKAYGLQDQGMDTIEANLRLGFAPDHRSYVVAGEIIKDLEVKRISLMTNNPEKVQSLERMGIVVEERIPIETDPRAENLRYLLTKKLQFNHFLCLPE